MLAQTQRWLGWVMGYTRLHEGNGTSSPDTKSLRLARRSASQTSRSDPARPKGSRLLRTVPEKMMGSCAAPWLC